MDIAKINRVLEKAPSVISFFCEQEIKEYQSMQTFHEQYRTLRAKKYLEMKAQGGMTEKEREYTLDIDTELVDLKNKELLAEINYKGLKNKVNKASDTLQATMELARLARKDMGSLGTTIK